MTFPGYASCRVVADNNNYNSYDSTYTYRCLYNVHVCTLFLKNINEIPHLFGIKSLLKKSGDVYVSRQTYICFKNIYRYGDVIMNDINGNCRDCVHCPYTDPGLCKKRKLIICYSDPGCSQLKRQSDFEQNIFIKPYIKKRNPSYKISPHCTINPRVCYCFDDLGVKRCNVGDKEFSRLKVRDMGNAVIRTSCGKHKILGLKDSDIKKTG